MAIAIGAMVGSGIFILPALAYRIAGPTVVLAFAIAAILVVPAAVSKAEMATAMPVDGGTYVYIERAMGPLLGTIAGVGTWFSLSFKGALALVGGVPYLIYVVGGELPISIEAIALLIAVVLILVNLVGSDITGRFQVSIVVVMLVAMAVFVLVGIPRSIGSTGVENAFNPSAAGSLPLLEAAGAVFVSYAGVTKVASVAEEIENPSRNIPIGMMGSLVFISLLYVLTVWVLIGVLPENDIGGLGNIAIPGAEDAVVAEAASLLLGTPGVILVTVAAMLALVSTANAGILSASRYPFAMARDDLAPSFLTDVSERFSTPSKAVTLTGAVILIMIAVFPILQIAKLASAFQILVFVLVNVALIGFREGAVDEYDPDWVAPLYPWMQLFGIVAGLGLLTQIGTIPLLGAIIITLGSIGWYVVYVRPRVGREGAARRGVRENIGEAGIERTEQLFEESQRYDTLVAVTDTTDPKTTVDLLRIGTDLSALRRGTVTVGTFSEVPHRVFTPGDTRSTPAEPPQWAKEADTLPVDPTAANGDSTQEQAASKPEVSFRSITTEDIGPAIVEFAAFEDQDFIILERNVEELHELYGEGLNEHVLKNAPCGVLLVEDRGLSDIDTIAVATDRGVYDPVKLLVADAIAEETGAELMLLQTIPENASDERRQVVQKYHDNLRRVLTVPADSRILKTDDRVAGLARFASDADLLVTTAERHGVRGAIFGRPGDRLVDTVDCTAVMVQPADEQQLGVIQRVVLNRLFG